MNIRRFTKAVDDSNHASHAITYLQTKKQWRIRLHNRIDRTGERPSYKTITAPTLEAVLAEASTYLENNPTIP